jgi:cytochrome c
MITPRVRFWLVVVVGLCVPGSGSAQELCTRGTEIAVPAICGIAVPNPRISCVVPPDVAPGFQEGTAAQRAFNVFGWQQFIALNWPAAPTVRGSPDPSRPIAAPGPRVWETWKETAAVYLPDGRKPPAWNAWPTGERTKQLVRTQKVEDVLDSAIQPTGADGTLPITLTDRNQRLVRYEIRMNRVLFDYVVANRLYDSRVQARATSIVAPDGAILVKAAWRELESTEEPRYLTARARICDSATRCSVRTVGLVGFHIMQKTKGSPQWIWSTFEHADNVEGDNPSFFDPACRDCGSVVNRQTPPGVKNQIVRVIPIPSVDPVCSAPQVGDNVAELNRHVSAALAGRGTPLARYGLISTQRPVKRSPPATGFDAEPPLLGNTTMETFIQPTSSCIGCHAMARTTRGDHFVSADFTFTLNNAGPLLPPPPHIRPAHQGSPSHQRARAIATRTYEMAPAPHVVAKLHCQSCHLEAGTNPRAGWWVGSSDRFAPRTKLFRRINQCFENSMNGAAICGSDADCARHPDMMALVNYIDDLTAEWRQRHGSRPAPAGFPRIATKIPDAANGQQLYQQRCAFCHGAEGEGRYASGTYYRPALWGPHSFDIDAGMARPATFAAFVHANMPFGSGGALTEQDAWDLAGFVDRQCRPKKPGCPRGN